MMSPLTALCQEETRMKFGDFVAQNSVSMKEGLLNIVF